jgi:5'-nucleotidase
LRILITNDDGIEAEGLKVLAHSLSEIGEVVIVAPDREQSATSHAITFHRPLRVEELGPRRWMVNGTSVDCVHLAVHKILDRRPDLVIAGINRGANLGWDVFYSGTVAGAREGMMLGIPSFAISLELRDNFPEKSPALDFQPSARFALRFIEFMKKNNLPARTFFNINVPGLSEDKILSPCFTCQGVRIYRGKIMEGTDPRGDRYYWIGGEVIGREPTGNSDIEAVEKCHISVTPFGLDITSRSALQGLSGLDL